MFYMCLDGGRHAHLNADQVAQIVSQKGGLTRTQPDGTIVMLDPVTELATGLIFTPAEQ